MAKDSWIKLIDNVFWEHVDREDKKGTHNTGVYLLTSKEGEHWIVMPRWHDASNCMSPGWTKGLYHIDKEYSERIKSKQEFK